MISVKLTKEQRAGLIRDVQTFFYDERNETIGELAADQLIDFMIRTVGPYVYNKAIGDTRNFLQEKMAQLDDEIYTLEQPVNYFKK